MADDVSVRSLRLFLALFAALMVADFPSRSWPKLPDQTEKTRAPSYVKMMGHASSSSDNAVGCFDVLRPPTPPLKNPVATKGDVKNKEETAAQEVATNKKGKEEMLGSFDALRPPTPPPKNLAVIEEDAKNLKKCGTGSRA